MKKATQRILCMLCAAIVVLALGTPAFAAGDERDIQIVHFYSDDEGNREYRMLEHAVSTASPTQLSTLTRPVLGQSGGDMEYDVVSFRLDIYYNNGDYDVREWTGAEVATASFQFQGPSKVRVYEAGMEYNNPRPVTTTPPTEPPVTPPTTEPPVTPPFSNGSSSGRGSGGSHSLGTIGVIGLPEDPVETGSTVKLTTIPTDTSVQYDEAVLSLERLANGEYRFTVLRDGPHSITFRRGGYYDRTVKITGRTTVFTGPVPLSGQENNTYNPSTGGYPDPIATDNPNTGAPELLGLAWEALLLSGAGIAGMRYCRHRED